MASILRDADIVPTRPHLPAALRFLAALPSSPFVYLLLLRFALLNILGAALLGAAWLNGLLTPVFSADSTGLVILIAVTFLAGLALCGRRILQTSIELNAVRNEQPRQGSRVRAHLDRALATDAQGRANLAAALKLKLATRIAPVRHIANSLVLLGLIGTVLGFIIALSGVDPDLAADIGAVGPMVSTLIEGMAVALYTTLAGSVLSVWLMINYRLLESGVVHLLTQVVERGEAQHGRA